MSLFKLIKHTLILTVFAGFYGCGGTVVEIMKEQMEQQLDELRLLEEEESKVVEPEVVKAVDESEKWEQNKFESAKRYAIWDNWRNQNYEYQYSDSELKIRLSFLFRSDYYVGEGAAGRTDLVSAFEIMIQNQTDSEFNLFVNNQDFKFLIDGKERTYGSVPAEGIEKLLLPYGSYDKTGKHREDLVILEFTHSQPLSEESIDRIFGSGDILEEEIIPIRVDRVDTGWFHTVTILLNGKKYPLEMNPDWSGLPILEDKELHDKIKLSPEVPSISNYPDWRNKGIYFGEGVIMTLASLRSMALNGSSNISIGKEYNVSKLNVWAEEYRQNISTGSGGWFQAPVTGKVYYDFGEKSDLKKVYYGTLLNGKKDGFFTNWYENGQKESEVTYKDGKEEGLWITWHENGQKFSESIYKDGYMIEGKWWDTEGNEIDDPYYDAY